MERREIKFRAWDIKNNKWISDFEVVINSNGKLVCAYSDKTFGEWKIEYILMQYTGLKDKNGKEIYEGDIVGYHYTSRDYKVGEMEWNEEDCKFTLGIVTLGYANREGMISRVRGNIYENPKLLNS